MPQLVLTPTDYKAPKNGYVYVYLSNESGEPVYFDNLSVSHERGRLIAEDHYYAYGLKITSISSKSISSSLNTKMPHYGYQGSFSEEVSEFELNYNEFELRTYDPQIGRWTTADPYDEFASPYLGMGTNPANLVDPDGGSVGGAILSFFGGGVSGSTASALAQVACPGMTASCTAASGFVTAIRIATVGIAVGGASFTHFSGQMMSGHMSAMQGSIGITSGSGAQSGGRVSQPGDGINQELNNYLSTNAGNEKKVDEPFQGIRPFKVDEIKKLIQNAIEGLNIPGRNGDLDCLNAFASNIRSLYGNNAPEKCPTDGTMSTALSELQNEGLARLKRVVQPRADGKRLTSRSHESYYNNGAFPKDIVDDNIIKDITNHTGPFMAGVFAVGIGAEYHSTIMVVVKDPSITLKSPDGRTFTGSSNNPFYIFIEDGGGAQFGYADEMKRLIVPFITGAKGYYNGRLCPGGKCYPRKDQDVDIGATIYDLYQKL
jgi:RHS repeat-associated protein